MQNLNSKLNTKEGRDFIHEKLKALASTAHHQRRSKGIGSFIKSIKDPKVVNAINLWIEKYTSICIERRDTGVHYMPPYATTPIKDLAAGFMNPYYSIELVSSYDIKSRTVQSLEKGRKTQLSDTQFKQKDLKLALSNFIDDPSITMRDRLITLINEFPLVKGAGRGSILIQGGKVGSKR
jgi:hypothetical protein